MENLKSYNDLIAENQLLHDIIEHVHEAVYAIDAQENVILFSHGMEVIEGLHKKDVLGVNERDVYSFIQGPSYNQVVTQQIRKTGKPLLNQVYTYNLADGRITNFMYNAYPFYHNKELTAIYSIGRNMDQIEEFISKTIETNNLLSRSKTDGTVARYFLDDIIGRSKNTRDAVKLARKVAVRSSPVLIYGRTGTGKELFAQGIHNASAHAAGPFVPVNCAAIPETLLEATLFGTTKGAFTGAVDHPGIFEQAKEGTVFLDEINSMPQALQVKLLRVLQEKKLRRLGGKEEISVNCRIISACNEDPYTEDRIRQDLLYRISTIIISVPSLRDRIQDVEELARHFIRKFNLQFGLFVRGIEPELLQAFHSYSWPGNVRELENVVETAMNMVEPREFHLRVKHLPLYIRSRLNLDHPEAEQEEPDEPYSDQDSLSDHDGTLKDKLWDFEKQLIEDTLLKHGGNVTRAAYELGIQRQNLHYRIRRFGLRNVCKTGVGE